MGDRHSGPRREVRGIRRVGVYGDVWWLHDLDCGHVERRKRIARAGVIGCAACKSEERLLINGLMAPDSDPGRDAQVQIEADRLRATLAASLGVPLDAVGVQVGMGAGGSHVTGAMIFLHPQAIHSVVDRLDSVGVLDYGQNLVESDQQVSYYIGESE